MVDRGYSMGDPIASSFVVLDLIPVVIFEVEFDREICTFEKDKISDVITDFEPCSVLQISSGDVLTSPSSNGHSSLEIFSQCHGGEVQPNVTTR